eukprot:TRINITY_DN110832_c0_g1_i1.p1 TRINITY_DN110832_c0_g1~~TRINITY_DN110832_c0_g1_i1.p1  ORF type:complete len:413 (+),score=81.21 TRINITY_DN110832_c0_g1_i1:92-1330(+)
MLAAVLIFCLFANSVVAKGSLFQIPSSISCTKHRCSSASIGAGSGADFGSMQHVGVVGAGVSGLVVASQLRKLDKGIRVTVFEWGRGPGGRTARRRVGLDGGEVSFDHAAPFFSVQSAAFRDGLLQDWQASGWAKRWLPRGSDEELWVGVPSNNAICKAMAADLAGTDDKLQDGGMENGSSVLYGRHARKAKFLDGRWQLTVTNRLEKDALEVYEFDALVLSDKLLVQPGQEYAILTESDAASLVPPLPTLRSSSQVALLLAFSKRLPVDMDLIRAVRGPLELLVRDSSKPQRGKGETWTARSTSHYADLHLIGEQLDDEAVVSQELQRAFFAALQVPVTEPLVAVAFAWDHAQPLEEDRLQELFSLDRSRCLAVCGDFYGAAGPRGVEAAALSGPALSRALLNVLTAKSDL